METLQFQCSAFPSSYSIDLKFNDSNPDVTYTRPTVFGTRLCAKISLQLGSTVTASLKAWGEPMACVFLVASGQACVEWRDWYLPT